MTRLTLNRHILVSCAVCFLVITPFQEHGIGQNSVQPSTPTTGQRIGTIIKDAIGSAFPGVAGIGGLIDAIWSHKPNNGNNVNKSQLQTATSNAQEDIKRNIVAQAQQKLVPLSEVATELQVVSLFGVPTATAVQDIIKMSDRIKSKKDLSEDDWTQVRADWEEAKGELASVKNADPSKIQDLWLRDKLTRIQQANTTSVARLDVELRPKAPNADRVSALLDQLLPTLQDISAAVGYEVSNMQSDLKAVSDWAKGAAGAEEFALSPEGEKYKEFLDQRYKQ